MNETSAPTKHWHWCESCQGSGFYPAGRYLGMPPEDEPCDACKETGRIVCEHECREKDWSGPCDADGRPMDDDLVWPQRY
jgi:DnaJ-class molecular chaperone